MVLSAVAYLASHSAGAVLATLLLILGTVLMTTAEMWSSAAAFVVSVRLAREEHRGKYLSVFGMGFGVEGAVGPSAGTALVASGAVLAWPVVAVVVTVGALWSSVILRGAGSPAAEPARVEAVR